MAEGCPGGLLCNANVWGDLHWNPDAYLLPISNAARARVQADCTAVQVITYVGSCSCVSHAKLCIGNFDCDRHTVWWEYRNRSAGLPPPHNDTRDAAGSGPPMGTRQRCWYNRNSFDTYARVVEGARWCVGTFGLLFGMSASLLGSMIRRELTERERRRVHPQPTSARAPAAAAATALPAPPAAPQSSSYSVSRHFQSVDKDVIPVPSVLPSPPSPDGI